VMIPLVDFGFGTALNTVLLGIAIWELRRHNIMANVLTAYPVIGLFFWTLAEVALRNRVDHAPLVYTVLMGSIGVSAVTDQTAGYILDIVTLPSCAFAIVTETSSAAGFHPLIGAFAVSGAMLVLYTITRRRGLGLGDVKLAAVSGTLLGPQTGLISLGVSFVLGGCMAGLLMLSGRASPKMTMPFAPYIAAGLLTVLTLAPA